MEAITIRMYESSEGGYMYDIYDHDHGADCMDENGDTPNCDSVGGGHCTTTMLNALGMAVQQAEDLIKREKPHECPGCNTSIEGYPALSRYGHGNLCSECGTREAIEGDFIGER